MKNKTRNI